jgi:hypothetical protein
MAQHYGIPCHDCNESPHLHTIYDWVTVAVFAGLIVLFLQRSMQDEPNDKLWHYLVASVGCAVTNYFGNQDPPQHLIAIACLIAVGVFIYFFIKPFEPAG